MAAIEEFQLANDSREHVPQDEQTNSWRAPTGGWVKANWDIRVDKRTRADGRGIVVRDSEGFVVEARCLTRPGNLEPNTAEALGALYAANFC